MRQGFRQARAGCHWSRGEYVISTIHGGGAPAGYLVMGPRRERLGRCATFDDAVTLAQDHAAPNIVNITTPELLAKRRG